MQHYYAAYNAYGVKTLNCWRIRSFSSRAERDAWVQADPMEQATRETVTAAEAKRRINSGNASADNDTMILLGYNADIYAC